MGRFALATAAVMVAILVIDYRLGPTAEYLNAHEILRRTFSTALPETSNRFVFAQDRLGRATLLVGWLAWTIEAVMATGLLFELLDAMVWLSRTLTEVLR